MSASRLTNVTTTATATTVPTAAIVQQSSVQSASAASSSSDNNGSSRKRPRDPDHVNDIYVEAKGAASLNSSGTSGDDTFEVQRTDQHHGNLVFWILLDRLYQRHYQASQSSAGKPLEMSPALMDTIVGKVQQAVGVLEPHPGRFVFEMGGGILVMESSSMIQSMIRRALLAHHRGQLVTLKAPAANQKEGLTVNLDHGQPKRRKSSADKAPPTQTLPQRISAKAPAQQTRIFEPRANQKPPLRMPTHTVPPPVQMQGPVITVPPQVTTTLNEKDVFWGGAFVNKYYHARYEGNRHFRTLIEAYGAVYDSSKRLHDEATRQGIVAQIVLKIRSAGGRFLMEQPGTPFSWMAVDDQVARLMTTNALETRHGSHMLQQQEPNGAGTLPTTPHLDKVGSPVERPPHKIKDEEDCNTEQADDKDKDSSMSVAAAIAAIAKSQKLEEDDDGDEKLSSCVLLCPDNDNECDDDDEVEYIATVLKDSKMASSTPAAVSSSRAIVPGKNDVVVSRRTKDGALMVDAEIGDLEQRGNRLFLNVVAKSIRERKEAVGMSVNAAVYSVRQLDPPGRFITYVPVDQQWQELDHAQVVSVVESALLAAAASACSAENTVTGQSKKTAAEEARNQKNLPPVMVSCVQAAKALEAPRRPRKSEGEKEMVERVGATKPSAPEERMISGNKPTVTTVRKGVATTKHSLQKQPRSEAVASELSAAARTNDTVSTTALLAPSQQQLNPTPASVNTTVNGTRAPVPPPQMPPTGNASLRKTLPSPQVPSWSPRNHLPPTNPNNALATKAPSVQPKEQSIGQKEPTNFAAATKVPVAPTRPQQEVVAGRKDLAMANVVVTRNDVISTAPSTGPEQRREGALPTATPTNNKPFAARSLTAPSHNKQVVPMSGRDPPPMQTAMATTAPSQQMQQQQAMHVSRTDVQPATVRTAVAVTRNQQKPPPTMIQTSANKQMVAASLQLDTRNIQTTEMTTKNVVSATTTAEARTQQHQRVPVSMPNTAVATKAAAVFTSPQQKEDTMQQQNVLPAGRVRTVPAQRQGRPIVTTQQTALAAAMEKLAAPKAPVAPSQQQEKGQENRQPGVTSNGIVRMAIAPAPAPHQQTVGTNQQHLASTTEQRAFSGNRSMVASSLQGGQGNRQPTVSEATAATKRADVGPSQHRQWVPVSESKTAVATTASKAAPTDKHREVAMYQQNMLSARGVPVISPQGQGTPAVTAQQTANRVATHEPRKSLPAPQQEQGTLMNKEDAQVVNNPVVPKEQKKGPSYLTVKNASTAVKNAFAPKDAAKDPTQSAMRNNALVNSAVLALARKSLIRSQYEQMGLFPMNGQNAPMGIGNSVVSHRYPPPVAPIAAAKLHVPATHLQHSGLVARSHPNPPPAILNDPRSTTHPAAPLHGQQAELVKTNKKDAPTTMRNNQSVATHPGAALYRQQEMLVPMAQRKQPVLSTEAAGESVRGPSGPPSRQPMMYNQVVATAHPHRGSSGVVPRINDVLCGGGEETVQHEGNLMFRRRIRNRLGLYAAASDNLKRIYEMEVIDLVRCFVPPARFLEFHPPGVWVEMPRDRILYLTWKCFQDEANGQSNALQTALRQQLWPPAQYHSRPTTLNYPCHAAVPALDSTKPYTQLNSAGIPTNSTNCMKSEGSKGATSVSSSLNTNLPSKPTPLESARTDKSKPTGKGQVGARVLEVEQSAGNGEVKVLWQRPVEAQTTPIAEEPEDASLEKPKPDVLEQDDDDLNMAQLEDAENSSFLQESITYAVDRIRHPDYILIPETCTTTKEYNVSEMRLSLSSYPRAPFDMVLFRGLAPKHAHLGIAVQCRYCHPVDGRSLSRQGCHVVSTSNELLWGVLELAWNHASCCNLVPPHMKAQVVATRCQFGKLEFIRDFCAMRRFCEAVGTHLKLGESKEVWNGLNSAANIDLSGPDDVVVARLKPVVSNISINMRSTMGMLLLFPVVSANSKSLMKCRPQFQVCCRCCHDENKNKSGSGSGSGSGKKMLSTRSVFVVSKAEDLWPAVYNIIHRHIASCTAISNPRRLEVARLGHLRTNKEDTKNLRRYCDACADVLFFPTRKSEGSGAELATSIGRGTRGGRRSSRNVPPLDASNVKTSSPCRASVQSSETPDKGGQQPEVVVASRVSDVEWAK